MEAIRRGEKLKEENQELKKVSSDTSIIDFYV